MEECDAMLHLKVHHMKFVNTWAFSTIALPSAYSTEDTSVVN